jgi:hypothetical protein
VRSKYIVDTSVLESGKAASSSGCARRGGQAGVRGADRRTPKKQRRARRILVASSLTAPGELEMIGKSCKGWARFGKDRGLVEPVDNVKESFDRHGSASARFRCVFPLSQSRQGRLGERTIRSAENLEIMHPTIYSDDRINADCALMASHFLFHWINRHNLGHYFWKGVGIFA